MLVLRKTSSSNCSPMKIVSLFFIFYNKSFCFFFKLDNTIKNRRLLVDLFINKIIIYDNDDIVIICKSHNNSLKTKNEHSNNEMFIFNRNGAPEGT